MDKLWTVFEFLVTVFEAFVIMHFVCAFFDHNFTSRKGKLIYVGGSVCYAFMALIINSLTPYEGLIGIFYSVYIFVFSLKFLRGSVVTKIFVSIFADLCLICINTFVVNLFWVLYEGDVDMIYSENTLPRFFMVIIVQVLLFNIFALFLKTFKKSGIDLGIKEWIFIILVFAVSFLSLAAIQITIRKNFLLKRYVAMLMAVEFSLILINVISSFMIFVLNSSHKAAEELSVIKQQDEQRRQYAENIRYRYDEIRRIRHDMKQSYTVLETLLSQNQISEALEYIRAGKSAISKTEVIIDVGNEFVNSILNTKLSAAKQLGIEVICSCAKDISGIEAADMCTLLGNMLDNAIEAAEQCPPEKRLIEVKITSSDGKVVIHAMNSIKGSVLDENNELKTTKQDSDEHGFGVKSIRLIAKKYSGTVNYFEENGELGCRVVLYR